MARPDVRGMAIRDQVDAVTDLVCSIQLAKASSISARTAGSVRPVRAGT
jgi:hypothetical protein